jgi:uncharacterized membrane protein (DUF485 family)
VERHEEWVRVERTSAFRELTQKRKAFILPATIFFLVFYVIGAINLAYIYAFAQFAMTWILMHLYVSRANGWDDLVDRARHEAADESGSSVGTGGSE